MNTRARAVKLHLLFSFGVACLAGLLVFGVWYPPLYAGLTGGMALFFMLTGIDAVLGPVLTGVVANPKKPRPELFRDIGLIVVLQLSALGYGMHTIALARPVHLVFEVDRFRVVRAVDIDESLLSKALPQYQQLPWTGPTLIAARKPSKNEEIERSLELELQGISLSMQPQHWADYASHVDEVFKKARPVGLLVDKYPQQAAELADMANRQHIPTSDLYFLTMESGKNSGVAVVAVPDGRFLAYLPVEGFF
jgi:hypothetical protein